MSEFNKIFREILPPETGERVVEEIKNNMERRFNNIMSKAEKIADEYRESGYKMHHLDELKELYVSFGRFEKSIQ